MTFDLILIGFGNVGRRFVTLLDALRPTLTRRHAFDARVVAIATRSRGCIAKPNGLDASALAQEVADGGIFDVPCSSAVPFLRNELRRHARAARESRLVVVETTTLDVERGQPATQHIRMALAAGAHAITANKGPAAFAYRQLAGAARRANRRFLFESAVLDGIPIFNLARATMPAVTVTGFRGVVNSTTNYILTAIEEGHSFEAALAAMQRAGIAEADPSLDVDGWDAAAKTAALANVLLDGRLTPHDIEREPLGAAASERVRAARAAGKRLKLVASAEREGGKVRGRVRLAELPEADLLARLEGAQNAIVFQTDLLGELAIVQRGSGLTQTAYGLVSDLAAIADSTPSTRLRAGAKPPRRPTARRDRSPSARGRRSR